LSIIMTIQIYTSLNLVDYAARTLN